MKSHDLYQVDSHRFEQAIRKQCYAILCALPIPDADLAPGEIDILDAQCHALGNSQARAIHQLGHQERGPAHSSQCHLHFLRAKHHGKAVLALDPLKVRDITEWLLKYRFVQEHDPIERLGLSRRRNPSGSSQVVQKGRYLCGSHLPRMPLAVEEDEAPDPVGICLFSAVTEMPAAAENRDLLE